MAECSKCPSFQQGIFCKFKDQEKMMEMLSQNKREHSYQRGDFLFNQGAEQKGLFCLGCGHVKITKAGEQGELSILKIAAAGDVLGHENFFSEEKFYLYNAISLSQSFACYIERPIILQMMQSNSMLSLELLKKMSIDLKEYGERIISYSHFDLRVRFAEFLLKLKKIYETEGQKNLKLTRDEISHLLGTTPETVSRIITQFKNENLIRFEKKFFLFQEIEKIKKIAQKMI